MPTKPDTKTAHTPWTTRPSGDGDLLWTVEDANGGIVFFGMEEDRAKLFAAAPDLLAALVALTTALRDGYSPNRHKLAAAEAAIAKAEGGAK